MALTEAEELELLELEEEEARLKTVKPQAQESTGSFGDELSSSLYKRRTAIKDIAADTDMGMPRKILRGVGEIAGGLVDVPMAAMKNGLAASTNLPIVGKGLQAAGNLGKQALSGAMNITNEIPGVQAGNRALSGIAERLSGIAERNPEAMKDLEALGNIGSVLPVGKVAGVAREAAAFGAGKGLQAAGAGLKRTGGIIEDVITPKLTKGLSRTTDISEGALTTASTAKGRAGLEMAKGSQYESGQKLLGGLKGKDFNLKLAKSNETVKEAIANTKNINFNNAIKALEKAKKIDNPLPEDLKAIQRIDDMIDLLENPTFDARNYSTSIRGLSKRIPQEVKDEIGSSIDDIVAKADAGEITSKNLKSRLLALKEEPQQFVDEMYPAMQYSDAKRASIKDGIIKTNQKIDALLKDIDLASQKGRTITAEQYLDLRLRVDKKIPFDDPSKDIIEKARMDMRQAMAEDLRQAAGDKYSAAMEDLHKKLDLRDMVVNEVEKNPERYLQNIYRKGNTQKLKDLELVDKELGLNLMGDIKLAQQAEEFGGSGAPSFFSAIFKKGKSAYLGTRAIGATKGAGKGISATGEKISGLGKRLMPDVDDASRMRTQVSSELMPRTAREYPAWMKKTEAEAKKYYGMNEGEFLNKIKTGEIDYPIDIEESNLYEYVRKNGALPEYKEGWRYGNIPDGGRSYNFAENKPEMGVSMMQVEGGNRAPGLFSMFNSGRPKVRVGGYDIGKGSDGEALLLSAKEIQNLNQKDYKKYQKILDDLAKINLRR